MFLGNATGNRGTGISLVEKSLSPTGAGSWLSTRFSRSNLPYPEPSVFVDRSELGVGERMSAWMRLTVSDAVECDPLVRRSVGAGSAVYSPLSTEAV
jgi:hypothetical protein